MAEETGIGCYHCHGNRRFKLETSIFFQMSISNTHVIFEEELQGVSVTHLFGLGYSTPFHTHCFANYLFSTLKTITKHYCHF